MQSFGQITGAFFAIIIGADLIILRAGVVAASSPTCENACDTGFLVSLFFSF